MATFVRGTQLSPKGQQQALSRFAHRFTKDHQPKWSRGEWKDGKSYPVQFASDRDWLEHTMFFAKRDGSLDDRHNYCESTPTWPDNPELREP